ncbi:hypothetical protein VTJ04DRAFT_4940 [Mycothermus thermophilus]|uniref:uncharacterized protein n=1 Tax=Humicola insolens TaxID=85995 RepID=UPI0037434DDC
MPPPKKNKPGRPPANRVTKPSAKTTTTKIRADDRLLAAAEEAAAAKKNAAPSGGGRGRKPAAAADEEEDTQMSDAPAPEAPASPPAKKRGRPKKVVAEADESPTTTSPPRKRKGAKKAEAEEEPSEVSEAQQEQQQEATQTDDDGDEGEEEERDDLAELPVPQSPARANKPTKNAAAPTPRSLSKISVLAPSPDKSGPELRRRLGELTQKYENLEHKYRDLKEIAVKEAERNFDKLRKQTEEKSKAADQLISALKAELAAQKEASKEVQRLKKQLEESESLAEALQNKVSDLTASLSESKSEIKSLNLKLAAARSAEPAAPAKVPGSAIKGSTAAARLAAAHAHAASDATIAAHKKKEDLYSDLTGLIVRGVKQEPGEDTFDCIQTGRNGTLHFKLAIDTNPEDGEAHCQYTPQLDPSRDRALIAILPNYLADEITFPQSQAGKFYARVLKALNEAAEG